MQPIAVIIAILAVLLAVAAGFFLARIHHRYQDFKARLTSALSRLDEISQKLEDAQYPRRRTHADTVRLEDLLAIAGDLQEEVERTGLYLDQEARRQMNHIRQLRSIAGSIFENLAEARNSKPTDFPDDKPFNGAPHGK